MRLPIIVFAIPVAVLFALALLIEHSRPPDTGAARERALRAPRVEVITEKVAPDGRHIATFYITSGGGAAGYVVMNVSVRERGQPFRAGHNNVFDMRHAYKVKLTWRDSTHLVVTYPEDADALQEATHIGPVNVSCVPRPMIDGS